MTKYSVDTLFQLLKDAHNPQPDLLDAFNNLVELVRDHFAAELEKQKALRWTNGDTYIDDRGTERSYHHMNRRRPSKSSQRPNLRKKSADVVQVDHDGWATRTKPRKSAGADDAEDDRDHFRDSVKGPGPAGGAIRAKPNNKNLGSSKAVDTRDTIADKPIKSFNAFEALGGSDDDDE